MECDGNLMEMGAGTLEENGNWQRPRMISFRLINIHREDLRMCEIFNKMLMRYIPVMLRPIRSSKTG